MDASPPPSVLPASLPVAVPAAVPVPVAVPVGAALPVAIPVSVPVGADVVGPAAATEGSDRGYMGMAVIPAELPDPDLQDAVLVLRRLVPRDPATRRRAFTHVLSELGERERL